MARVLVVDDDRNLLKVVEYNLKEDGHQVMTASSGREALDIIKGDGPDLVLTDVRMPGMTGMELLEHVKAEAPGTPVILITAFAAVDSAVEAIKAGAVDYIPKPFNKDDLIYKVKKALEHVRLKQENTRLKAELAREKGLEGMIGRSPAMKKLFDMISLVADSDSTVLITGASGTGKELAARAIHGLSSRADGPYITVNCAAIPGGLLESDLFGHVKGAFTGAVRDKPGKFEAAHNGTIFLDEIADLSLELQPKLLRALQQREVQRVGDTRTRKVNVRLIAATITDLKKKVEAGEFREDLYYRLNVIPISMPPLKERRGDVPLLAGHFLQKHSSDRLAWSGEAMQALEDYDWPGNVRELENLVERVAVLRRGREGEIRKEDLPPEITAAARAPAAGFPGLDGKTLRQAEKEMVEQALAEAKGNKAKAARMLGIPRHVLLYRIKKYGIKT